MTQGRSADGNGGTRRLGLLWSLGLSGLCAASLAGACLYFFLAYVPGRRAAAIRRCQEELGLRANSHRKTFDQWIAAGMADAETVASYSGPLASLTGTAQGAGPGSMTAAQSRELVEHLVRIGSYDRLALLDASLRITIEVGKKEPLEPPVLRAAAQVLARGSPAVDFHRHADGSVAVAFLARVGTASASKADELAGPAALVLLETDPNRWLYPFLAMRPMAAASAEAVLIQRQGDDILYLSPLQHNPAAPLTFRRPANLPGLAALAAVERREGVGAFVDYRGEPVFAAVARLGRAPWGIVVKVDQREVLAAFRQEARHTGATAAVAILSFWAVPFLLIRAWRRRAEAALRERDLRYRLLFESMQEGFAYCRMLYRDGRPDDFVYLAVNPAFEKLTGLKNVVGKKVTEAIPGIRESSPELFEAYGRVVSTGRPEKFDIYLGALDIWFSVAVHSVEQGHFIAVFDNITERKRTEAELAAAHSELEKRVAERTSELLVANQELESFAYAVSHDLRAPLRGIDGWSQAVLEDCGPQLDDRGRKYLKLVRSETQRMSQLIDDLLELSRVTRAPMRRETVDLTAMAQELEASLRANQPERVVDFVVAPKMVAEGDAVLLRAALQNLLGNAWKFTGKRPRARIEVGCASEDGRTVYHVRDDGVGFDMRYASKLLAPFQRLHSLEEFPGTGIGLATVQRIIHRHGGKVWAKAEVDQGATFYFTLTA